MPISLQAIAYIQPASTMLYLGLESGIERYAGIGVASNRRLSTDKAGALMSEPLECRFGVGATTPALDRWQNTCTKACLTPCKAPRLGRPNESRTTARALRR